MVATSTQLLVELERHIQTRTGRRIRNLSVEMNPDRVILRGRTTTYYLKQLAQQGVLEVLPEVGLDNAIVVDSN
jgi:hypothetical protein